MGMQNLRLKALNFWLSKQLNKSSIRCCNSAVLCYCIPTEANNPSENIMTKYKYNVVIKFKNIPHFKCTTMAINSYQAQRQAVALSGCKGDEMFSNESTAKLVKSQLTTP